MAVGPAIRPFATSHKCPQPAPGRARSDLVPSRRRMLESPSGIGTPHTQLLHPKTQRVRVDSQALCGISDSADSPAAPLEDGLDVRSLNGVEIVRRFFLR